MNRYSKLPARFLLVLLGTILITAGMTSVSLANTPTPNFHGSYFDLVHSSSTRAYFAINTRCDETDENCTQWWFEGPPQMTTMERPMTGLSR